MYVMYMCPMQLTIKRKPLGDLTNRQPSPAPQIDSSDEELPDDDLDSEWLGSSLAEVEQGDEEVQAQTSWTELLPPDLARNQAWLHFFQQQLKNYKSYKRWSVR